MGRDDAEQFAQAWAGAWDVYGRNCTSASIRLSFRALQDLALDAVLPALHAHLNENPNNPPTPASIRQRIEGDPETRIHLAWSKFRQSVMRAGPYRSVIFDDPIIHAVVRDLGGWIACNDWQETELPFREQDFRRAYRAYIKSGQFPYPPKLAGIADTHNGAAGFAQEAPMLIGNKQACLRVLDRATSRASPDSADAEVAALAYKLRGAGRTKLGEPPGQAND